MLDAGAYHEAALALVRGEGYPEAVFWQPPGYPFFLALVGVTAASGALLWTDLVPRFVPLWTLAFVIGGWVISLCVHEFGHAVVAYLGGDRSVVGAGSVAGLLAVLLAKATGRL